MRKQVYTIQMVILQTTMSNIPSMDTQKDHCLVSVSYQLDLEAKSVIAYWQKHKTQVNESSVIQYCLEKVMLLNFPTFCYVT